MITHFAGHAQDPSFITLTLTVTVFPASPTLLFIIITQTNKIHIYFLIYNTRIVNFEQVILFYLCNLISAAKELFDVHEMFIVKDDADSLFPCRAISHIIWLYEPFLLNSFSLYEPSILILTQAHVTLSLTLYHTKLISYITANTGKCQFAST